MAMATLQKEKILEDVERIENYLADKKSHLIQVMSLHNSNGNFYLSYNVVDKDYTLQYSTATGKMGQIPKLKTTLEAVEKLYESQNY